MGGVEEGVGVVTDSVVKVFTFAAEAVERCLKLTEGWGLTALIKAIREVRSQHLCVAFIISGSPSPQLSQ